MAEDQDLVDNLRKLDKSCTHYTITKTCSQAADEIERLKAGHCRDCCCARSWKALGFTGYTGQSIPEHIERLHSVALAARALVQSVHDSLASSDPDEAAVSEPALTELERALEIAGLDITEQGVTSSVEQA